MFRPAHIKNVHVYVPNDRNADYRVLAWVGWPVQSHNHTRHTPVFFLPDSLHRVSTKLVLQLGASVPHPGNAGSKCK